MLPDSSIARNLALFFGVTFALTTTFDIWTTWVGVHQFGYTELNPFTDTSSIQAMATPEVITLFIGMATVATAAHFSKTLRPLPDERFRSFYKRFFSAEKPLKFLICLPILLAVARSVAVLNNTSLILYDQGLYGVTTPWLNMSVRAIAYILLMHPTMYFIYVICFRSKR
ncbi:MAG: hypothetical protein OXI90_08495 [Gammaproteobacteria bacterium]|nr:hypothetical protein [Gammaproteobacteria bacterium]